MSGHRQLHSQAFCAADHDHAHCIADAVSTANALCQRRGVRLTALRRRVFELVWSSHKPLGAYAILEMYREYDRRAAPPTVYRALGFLLDQGLVHRIASLNAYVGCVSPSTPHGGQFLICSECGDVLELHTQAVDQALERSAEHVGFEIEHQTIEVIGRCPRCRASAAGARHD